MDTAFIRRRQLLIAGGGAAVFAGSGTRAHAFRSPEISQIDIMLDGAPQLRHVPLHLAQSLGFFEQEQLQVRLTTAPTMAHTLEQQAGLRSDVFVGSFERVLYMHAQGLPSQAFFMLTKSPGVVLGVQSHLIPGVQQVEGVAELKGLRWAAGPEGGLTHRIALLSLQRLGLRSADVQWSHHALQADVVRQFESQQVDVACLNDMAATQLERSGQFRVLLDTRTQRDTEWLFSGPAAGMSLSAAPAFIERNPQTIQATTQAVLKALLWMRTATPTDLTRHVPAGLLDRDAVVFFDAWARARESLSSDGVFPDGAALNMLKSLSRLQLITDAGSVNPSQTFNNRFAIRSRQQLRA